MSAKIFLHIGINETGTSDLQRWLAANRAPLLNRGILYPATGRKGDRHDFLARILEPHLVDDMNIPAQIDVSRMLSIRDDLRSEIAASGANHVIISSADFAGLLDLAPVQDLFRTMQVQVVISLRRHDYWWEAVYRQSIANHCANVDIDPTLLPEPGFPAFLRTRSSELPNVSDYQWLVDHWAAAFGQQNIIINPCEEPLRTETSIAGFLQAIGLPECADGLPVPTMPIPRLQSLSRRQLQLVEIFLRVPAPPELRQQLLDYATATSGNEGVPVRILAPDRRAALVKQNVPVYQGIARTFLGRKNGRLFAMPAPPEKDDSWEAPREISAVDSAAEVIKALTAPPGKPGPTTRPGFLARLLAAG